MSIPSNCENQAQKLPNSYRILPLLEPAKQTAAYLLCQGVRQMPQLKRVCPL